MRSSTQVCKQQHYTVLYIFYDMYIRSSKFKLSSFQNNNYQMYTYGLPPDGELRYARNMYRLTNYTKNKLCIMLVFLYTIISRCRTTKQKIIRQITKQIKQIQYKIHTKWNSHHTIKYPQYKVTLMYMVVLSPRTSPLYPNGKEWVALNLGLHGIYLYIYVVYRQIQDLFPSRLAQSIKITTLNSKIAVDGWAQQDKERQQWRAVVNTVMKR